MILIIKLRKITGTPRPDPWQATQTIYCVPKCGFFQKVKSYVQPCTHCPARR
jgi:hypothetical protein